MSPKEKAIKLVERFENLQSNKMSDYSRIEYPTAKLCALIAADEIIKALEIDAGNWIKWNETKKYWQEVKQEIEKL